MGTEAPLLDISEDALVKFETAVYPAPQFDTEDLTMISQGPSVCVFNKEDPQEVLASWLFAQFLLTNEVQIPYAQTEGYVPVTTKAQQTDEYQTYLANDGIDNDKHYTVKLQATKLLLQNIDNTFVTPVFGNSASLRNAAGQLVENITKSVRRKETIDDAYFEKLYRDVASLYRLDQGSETQTVGGDLGPLPRLSTVLLCTLGGIWTIFIAYTVISWLKKSRNNTKSC
jgi:multiple sugar transport system substrate-binding protein